MTGKTLQLGEQKMLCQSGATVLDALLRELVEINHSCKQGVCQSCLSRSLDVAPPVSVHSMA
ncbi:MAG: 2Fe-2S iron-sulfur cluster-binding protein [Methyloprofundus sp.]|uniref:2Fe-2S iron-sulfur cluster-binding protein n=1 Tax=Methyloprofundus sp. TaxID=2020875 RepID=UPI003259FBE2